MDFFQQKTTLQRFLSRNRKKYNNGLMLNWNKHKKTPDKYCTVHAKFKGCEFKIVQVAHRGNSYDNQYWIFITTFLHVCPPSILKVVYQIQINRNQQWLSLRIKYHLSFQMTNVNVLSCSHSPSLRWLVDLEDVLVEKNRTEWKVTEIFFLTFAFHVSEAHWQANEAILNF